jgi:hypothetical protein
MPDGAAVILSTFGIPSSTHAFGNITDPVQNGKMPGGLAMDATNPGGEVQTRLSTQVDPKGALHPKTSPLPWVIFMVVAFMALNAHERRGRRRGK